MNIEVEREAFEQWWQSRGMFKPSRSTEPGYTHEYDSAIAENGWKAWQARGDGAFMWRDISTAPKDGTQIQLYFPKRYQGKGGISWGCFMNGDWLDSRAIRDNDASHWAPMLAPPRP